MSLSPKKLYPYERSVVWSKIDIRLAQLHVASDNFFVSEMRTLNNEVAHFLDILEADDRAKSLGLADGESFATGCKIRG